MGKTNHAIKKTKFFRLLLVFFIVQVVIIIFFSLFLHIHSPIQYEKIQQASIVIDKIEIGHFWGGGQELSIFSNSTEYSFPKIPVLGTEECSADKIKEQISIGETLHIYYVEEEGIAGTSYCILDAYSEDQVFRTLEGYNSWLSGQRKLDIVLFIFIEIGFLFVVAIFIFINRDLLRSRKKRKKIQGNIERDKARPYS